ncbi:hypothetical protein [Pendulispora albinea]|uniref:Uncharacterized protein n=1 Tax=Pendulispora albinea TaxID=2741071 RepID=A0ABZ2LRS5_9BACT
MPNFFDELGALVEATWVRANAKEADFPKICTDILARRPPSEDVGIDDVIRLGFGSERLVRQIDADSDFGQPAITLFANGLFYISVLFWMDATTGIHEHGFNGAFHVLHGHSLHTTFSFEDQHIVNEHMKLGRLRENTPEVLNRGATREILPLGGTIHSLFHLGHPSATVVVRTYRSSVARPQYTYWRPGIACHEDYDRKELTLRRAMMTLIYRTSPGNLFDYVQRWMAGTDFVSAFLGLQHCLSLVSAEEGDELIERVRRNHEQIATLARDVTENFRRELFITRRRQVVTDPELRFFLAVLLNVRGSKDAKRIVSQQFPGAEPVDRMIEWTRALGKLPPMDAGEDSALGVQVDDLLLGVLRGLLTGAPDGDVIGNAERSLGRRISERDRSDLRALCGALRGSELFRYVLS